MSLTGLEGALAHWAPVGRAVRPGTWQEQAVPTPDAIEAAVADGRLADAAALARHLVVEAEEIHELYSAWCLQLAGEPVAGADREWADFGAAVEAFAAGCEAGSPDPGALEHALETWRVAHDRHRDELASRLATVLQVRGVERLGDVWRELMADGIAAYGRYSTDVTPWPQSFELLVQIAIEGMHGHLGGPRRRGEVTVTETDERVSMTFEPCGSGGIIRAQERFGVTEERHDFAWNEVGVCHYCVHCCVLQQLTPIDTLGYPARVIDPPLQAGDPCTWTVYRDPSLVPDEAYERVGRRRPERA